ncbi:hypothetical protein [Companilactobacillus kimchii]|uniref:Antitoxin n=2 Tax=Companilactobacillus kimchii TaxID=2801452 RepID=A0ABR5NPX6_9LACO|nr:hypothetical protein [Companilactobacillus kimchii]KAE9562700.1 hypothetical protein ATN91_00630 [Companilactobacillus kimchii]KRK49730.1 hypothetical protein FC97_GL002109 [Companilactobacillus kimchii DSM 13961 = JCM 10707]OWF33306.1 hypothetical protein LKACC12383_01374 [Companilactobacillus kimchii]GEO46610.1 hypothetical protein LKI01_06090 [Companilactobacillus paralimentarius]
MSEIKPISSLREYTKVFSELREGNPITFIKDGNEVGTLVNSKEWNKIQAEIKLLNELNYEDNLFDGMSLSKFRKLHDRK